MTLLALGINHKTAPVAVRERVTFAPERLPDALQGLISCNGIEEAAILSTCNRTDLYCGLSGGDGDEALHWLRNYYGLELREIKPYIYTHRADYAVRHLMRVASGLDSMMLGEPQILGQVKDAYNVARDSGTIGRRLGRLFQFTFSVAKQVRTDTAISSSPVSVAFAAVTLAKQIFGDLVSHTALLIGAGQTIELAARHLKKNGLGRLVIANRTVENAHRLASEIGGYGISLSEVASHLVEADILISSTASQAPILSLQQAQVAVKARKHRPMFMVDIAVPRDVEPAVGHLPDVYLYTVDDLTEVIQENLRARGEAAGQAEELIDAQVDHFMGWLGVQNVVVTIQDVRKRAENTRDEVLAKARRRLAAGATPEEVLGFLAHSLTNKLLHDPTSSLRDAGSEGQNEIVDAARILFGLGVDDDNPPKE